MAIVLRSRQQIDGLHAANRLVLDTFELLRSQIKPGVSGRALDRMAEEYIRSKGGVPAYKGYRGGGRSLPPFPGTLCISVNNVICHGIPSDERLREGDIVGVDVGVIYKGWVGDACVTYPVGTVAPETQRLLDVAQECMWCGIRAALPGNRLGDIGAAIQSHVEANGFSIVREYTGHGVGQKLHEDPTVLHYGKPGTGIRLRPGMVFTIEPMVNAGAPTTMLDARDQWTVRTADGSLSAQFEHSIAVSDDGPIVLGRA